MGQDFLAFDRPHIEKDEIEEVIDTLKSGWIITGLKMKRVQ